MVSELGWAGHAGISCESPCRLAWHPFRKGLREGLPGKEEKEERQDVLLIPLISL